VLDDAPARLERFASTGDGMNAEDVVARGTRLQPARAGKVGRQHATDRTAALSLAEQRAVVERLELELLVVLGQQRLDLGERRSGARRKHQFLRLIERDTCQLRQVNLVLGLCDMADAALRPLAQHLDGRFLGHRPAEGLEHFFRCGWRKTGHQNLGMSGKAIWPRWTCMRPSSAQRCSCGNTLPGLSRWLGSKAHLTRICWLRSSSENISGIRSRFSTPTPCSPVSTPPTFTQSRRMSAPNASARSNSSSLLAS